MRAYDASGVSVLVCEHGLWCLLERMMRMMRQTLLMIADVIDDSVAFAVSDVSACSL